MTFSTLHPTPAQRVTIWRLMLAIATAAAVTMALLPHPPANPLEAWGDKAMHMTAFATLALLAALAYPDWPLPRVAERLSFLGAMIELLQSIPALHRDCDIMDWVADTAAILTVLIVVRLIRGRRDAHLL